MMRRDERDLDEQAETPYDGGGRASAGSLRVRSRRQILQSTAFYTNTLACRMARGLRDGGRTAELVIRPFHLCRAGQHREGLQRTVADYRHRLFSTLSARVHVHAAL
jgi:hypothetical protein